jgi:hypothetical protein
LTTVYQYGDREAAIVAVRRMSRRLRGMVAADDKLAAAFQTALDGIVAEAAETDPSLPMLVGYVQSAIRQPALVSGSLDDRFDAFSFLADDLLALLSPIEVTGYGRWTARTVEMALMATLTSMSRVVTTSVPDTRAHAISVAVRILDEFWDIVDALDTVAAAFDAQDWDARYFSQSTTYTIAARLVTECIRYLLKSAYDLRVEKRFTLGNPTAPIVLAIKEYPGYEIDRALDLLIKANALSGNDILLIPAGREIVVYV